MRKNKITGAILLVLILVAAMTVAGAKPDTNTINVNGAGRILSVINTMTEETVKSSLELNVQTKDRINKGSVRYHDGILNIDVKSLDISEVAVYNVTYNAVEIAGNATINGTGSYPFYIAVSDTGEPSRNNDFFMITLPSIPYTGGAAQYVPAVPPWVIIHDPYEPDLVAPYSNYGYLEGGNIQIKINGL